MAIQLPRDLERRLLELAERENRPPEAVINDLLDLYDASHPPQEDEQAENVLLLMAADAEAANLVFSDDDVARHSREILEQEYADELLRRMRRKDAK
jgi:predicted transcriptional regulator